MLDRNEKGQFVEGNTEGPGRHSILTDSFMDFILKTMSVGIRMIIFTDEDCVAHINDELGLLTEEQRKERELPKSISIDSWKAWKSLALSGKGQPRHFRFLTIIKSLLKTQKEGLFNKMATDDKAWTRWAWIIERKFDEWNLRSKAEVKTDNINEIQLEIIHSNSHETKDTDNAINDKEQGEPGENND